MRNNEIQRLKILMVDLVLVFVSILISSMLPYADIDKISVFVLVVIHLFLTFQLHLYDQIGVKTFFREFISIFKYSIAFLFLLTFFYAISLNSPIISRRGIFYFILINGLLLYLYHATIIVFWSKIQHHAKEKQKIILITVYDRVDSIIETFKTTKTSMEDIVAIHFLDEKSNANSARLYLGEYRVINYDELFTFATRSIVDHVFINAPSAYYPFTEYIQFFESIGIATSINLDFTNVNITGQQKIEQLSTYTVMTFSTTFYKPSHVLLKRCLDIVGSIVGLLICGIVAIFLVPIIRRDGGPAFFVQERVGRNGRIFKFYKFRSMKEDAEESKKELMQQNTMSGPMFKIDEDPRITPIGHFIRKTSLDELPQFWNVLRGDMSLVGTRPPTTDEFETYTPETKRRLSFKPGITGLWQVSGRSNIKDFETIVKLDVAYIDNWTIWSDIKILLKTIKVIFMREGAK